MANHYTIVYNTHHTTEHAYLSNEIYKRDSPAALCAARACCRSAIVFLFHRQHMFLSVCFIGAVPTNLDARNRYMLHGYLVMRHIRAHIYFCHMMLLLRRATLHLASISEIQPAVNAESCALCHLHRHRAIKPGRARTVASRIQVNTATRNIALTSTTRTGAKCAKHIAHTLRRCVARYARKYDRIQTPIYANNHTYTHERTRHTQTVAQAQI